jgi:hypothetical protein
MTTMKRGCCGGVVLGSGGRGPEADRQSSWSVQVSSEGVSGRGETSTGRQATECAVINDGGRHGKKGT